MERAATQWFKRQSINRAFFQNFRLSNFYLDLRPPGADPRARQRNRKPNPRGNWNVRIPGGRPGGWSGLELTDT